MFLSRRLFLFIIALCMAAGLHASPPSGFESELKQWLGDQPGGVAAAYIDKGGVTYANAGKYSATDFTPVTSRTQFEIGSVTKIFTALLLAESVRLEKMKPTDFVGAPFPLSRITYEQLATHTSGLPRLPTDMNTANPRNPYAGQDLATLVQSFAVAAPSAKVSPSTYSNFGYAVLGQAVARVWEKDYETILTEKILQPLGMTGTATSWQGVEPKAVATPHNENGETSRWDMAAYAPAGGLISNTTDLSELVQVALSFKRSSLAPAIELSLRPRVPGDSPARRISLGWVLEQRGASTLYWHNGGTGGYRSFIGFDRAKGVGVILLTNHTTGLESLGFALLDGSPFVPKAPPLAPAESVKEFIGFYPITPAFAIVITAEGEQLFAQATNQARLKLNRVKKDRYAVAGVAAEISFDRRKGKISGLVLHQNGVDQKAPYNPLKTN